MNRRKALKNIAFGGASVGALNLEGLSAGEKALVEETQKMILFNNPAAFYLDTSLEKAEKHSKLGYYIQDTPSEIIRKEVRAMLQLICSVYQADDENFENLEKVYDYLGKTDFYEILKGIDKFFPKRAIV